MCCNAGAHAHCSVGCLAPRQQLWLPWSATRSFARFFVKEVQTLPCSPSIGSPFTSHCITGLGFPLARHTSLPSSPGARMRFWGSSNQYGAALKYANAPVINAAVLPHPKSPPCPHTAELRHKNTVLSSGLSWVQREWRVLFAPLWPQSSCFAQNRSHLHQRNSAELHQLRSRLTLL